MASSLEQELSALENQLAAASKAAKVALAELKKAQSGAKVGQLRDLSRSLAEDAMLPSDSRKKWQVRIPRGNSKLSLPSRKEDI